MSDFYGDERAVTLSAPPRETRGFGCGGCGRPWPMDAGMLRRAAARGGFACCGYHPSPPETLRMLKAAELIERA